MFNTFWPVLPAKLTIGILLPDRWRISFFFSVSGNHMCPYCESILWVNSVIRDGYSISSRRCLTTSWNCSVMGLACLSSYRTDINASYKSPEIIILFNVLTIGVISALHAKWLSLSCNGEEFILLTSSSDIFTKTLLLFQQWKILLRNIMEQDHCEM